MRKFLILILSFMLIISLLACGEDSDGNNGNINNNDETKEESAEGVRIKLTLGAETAFIKLTDCSAAKDLTARLKISSIELTFSDFGGSEKIASPSPPLDITKSEGCNPIVGDVTIYKPWGNIAVFYKDTSEYSSSLTLVGKIEGDGIKILAKQKNDFNVIMELIN